MPESVQLKQKRKEVPDGECAQKETATPAVFTSPQQLSGNQNNPSLPLARATNRARTDSD